MKILALRTVDKDRRSYHGFQWPGVGGIAEAPDWDGGLPCCGCKLHGLECGIGNGSLLQTDGLFQWVEVETDEGYVEIGDKIGFRRGKVVFEGDRIGMSDFAHRAGLSGFVFEIATAGYRGTATAGYGGTATAGYRGTATAGYGGTATAGDSGTVIVKRWDGNRYRLVVGYVGENGIWPNVPYKLNDAGVLVRSE